MNLIRLAAAMAAFALTSAYADVRQETRNVSGFDSISLAVPVDLEITQGDAEGLTLQGEAETLAKIETVVDDGTLRIRTPRHVGSVSYNGKVTGRVFVRSVKGLAISGAGNIRSGALRAPALHISISGAGDVDVARLDATNVDVSIAGSGDVRYYGDPAVSRSVLGSGSIKRLGASPA